MSPTKTSMMETFRRTEMTCKARYHAARRLSTHSWLSQWTLALLAIGQIVISLIAALKLPCQYSPEYLSFGGIFFGILVLAYSLLLGMANYSSRAVRLHECGLDLGRLARELYPTVQDGYEPVPSEYERARTKYYDILEKYENHTRTDYLTAHYEYYDGKISKMPVCSTERVYSRFMLEWVHLKVYFFHALQFMHYVVSISLIYSWIYCLVR